MVCRIPKKVTAEHIAEWIGDTQQKQADMAALRQQYGAPANKREALQKIIDTYRKQGNRLARAQYRDETGDVCAIGALLTPEQIADLQNREYNDYLVRALARKTRVGKQNIEFMAGGLTVKDLQHIQAMNDSPRTQPVLISQIERALRDNTPVRLQPQFPDPPHFIKLD